MANIKISELNALTPPAAADELPVVDVSITSTKKTTVGEVVGIINGDVEVATDGTATISELPVSKLQDGAARQLLQTDAAGTGVEWTSNVDVPGTLDVTGAATLDSTLGVNGQSTLSSAAVSDLTNGRVVLAGTSGELEDNAALTFNGTQLDVDGDIVITGDLTVEGATTTLETQTITVEDKNIELGVVGTPTDTTADGGGITLKGATDKTINWVNATDAWTFSEHVELASGKEFYIDGNGVLNATTLGSGVVNSSLTSVGTIGTGTWQGTTIATAYGGTGQTTYANGELLIGNTTGNTLSKATLTAGTGISVTNGSGSISVAIDSSVVTTSDTGTVTSTMILDGTIVNGDINASAAIADTKLATISTAGKVSNSATTATDANTASAIVARDASGNFTAGTITAALTGNANTATALETARSIGGVPFDGTADINLPGVNTTGNQDTSGNAATATKLDSSRAFAVTGDVTGTVNSDLTSGVSIATSIASGAIVNDDINVSAAIADTKLDTISTAGKVSNSATTATDANTANAIVARDASGDFSAGTITADLTGNADTATALSSNRTFAITGDVTGTVSSDLTSGASIATSIASGVIVDADVDASAAIAGTKIDPDFGSQTVETTGDLAINTDVLFVDSSESAVGIGTTLVTNLLHLRSDSTSAVDHLYLQNRNGGSNSGARIAFSNGTVDYGDNRYAYIGAVNTGASQSGNHLVFATNADGGSASEKARIDSSGRLLVGTPSQAGGSLLQVNDDRIRIASSKTPASATDTGTAGEICWDADYVYVAVGTNTWKRAALSTW